MNVIIGHFEQSSRPHMHENYEIIVYENAQKGFFCAQGKETPVSAGKIVIVPPYVVHNSGGREPNEGFYICGDFGHFFDLTAPAVVLDNAENEGMRLAKMIYSNRFANNEYVAALIDALARFLLQNMKIESRVGQVIENIAEEIRNRYYDSKLEIGALLKISGYAEDYIRAQFKKYTGKTPTEFLTKVRILKACYLIDIYSDSVFLTEIAEKCGYTDYAYFSRCFKRHMGVSPRTYLAKKTSV